MAASTLALLDGGLKRIYSDETFEYAQNAASPLVEKFDEAKNLEPFGDGFFWPFMLRSPQNIGTPAEAGNVPAIRQRTEVQGKVRAGQFVGGFEISFMVEEAGNARGTWNKGEVKKHSFDTLRDLVKHRNRIYAGTHGSGRIAQVQTATVSTNQFVAKLDTLNGAGFGGAGFGAHLLRPNMLIEIRNADSGGAVVISARKITEIDRATRTITYDGAAASLGADDHVYIEGSYGNTTVPNGLMGLVDDGEYLVTIHNQSRITNPELKSQVFRNNGTLRTLSEDLLINAGLLLRQAVGGAVDLIVMNTGQFAQWIKVVRPTRFNDVSKVSSPKYATGFDAESTFKLFFDGRPVGFLVAEDVAPRHIYGLDMSQMRKVTLRKLGWLDHGGSIFTQGVDSVGFKTTKQATMYSLENIATFAPWAHYRIDDLLDPQLAGTAFGGAEAG